MIELAGLQLVQPVGTRSVARGPTNQEVGASPPLGFPHTMLNVERVKNNLRLAFIEKLFTNRTIETNMQQDTCTSKVCHTRVIATYVTSIVFSCKKLWPSFGVITRNLR
jgi:hypothetical protein